MNGFGMRGALGRALLSAALAWAGLAAALTVGTAARAQVRLSNDSHGYPRVKRLPSGELIASATMFSTNSISIFSSTDDGATFSKVASITDPEFQTGLCCGALFVLTQAVGPLTSGTILWAGSVGQNATNRRMKIKIYKSTNAGRNWTYLSAITAPNTGGLWEPEFSIANDGALVMMYSDETQSGTYSQKLMKTRSYNGTTWQDTANLVATSIQADRPGMAVVSRLADGRRFLTHELCGPAACTVFHKVSTDGWNWVAGVGAAIRLSDGRYFAHAPNNRVMPNGAILVVGQLLKNASNATAPGSGTVLFKSANGNPAGPWTTIAAPVPVPEASNRPCVNYSSALLPVTGGTQVLEIAGRLDNNVCYLYFAKGGF